MDEPRFLVKPGGPFNEPGTFGVFDSEKRSWPAAIGTRSITQGGTLDAANRDAAWLEKQARSGRI